MLDQRRTHLALALLGALLATGACAPDDDGAAGDAPPDVGEDPGLEGEAPQRITAEDLQAWDFRLDSEGADTSGFQLVADEGALRITTGPAGITWRPADVMESGDYTAAATFTELGSPADHREAYGLFVGGRNLNSPDQSYTYFLVRGDGSYLIKRRTGEATSTLVDWQESDAVQAVSEEAEETPNELAVRVRGEQVEFLANGTVLETLPAEEVRPWGVAGLRVNHRLDLRVEGFSAGAAG